MVFVLVLSTFVLVACAWLSVFVVLKNNRNLSKEVNRLAIENEYLQHMLYDNEIPIKINWREEAANGWRWTV